MDSPIRTVLVTTLIGAICAVLLVGVRGFVLANIERNLSIDEQRAILEALDVRNQDGNKAASASAAQVETYYRQFVRKVHGEEAKEMEFDVFRYFKDERVEGTAIRVFGKGLWGEMRGFLALEPKVPGQETWTVRGLIIYRDEETPGLGKRIRDEDFKSRFRASVGKLVPGLKILKSEGLAEGPYEIDGLTSATITSQGIQGMVNRAIEWYAASDLVSGTDKGGQA